MSAAVELIAEVGWGRITTRAGAERAGLPHGAVSYHFRGQQELLIQASLSTFERAFPIAEFEALSTVEDLLALIAAEFAGGEAADSRLAGLMMESMREADRDDVLRERLADMTGAYRRLMTEVLRVDQERGVMFAGTSAQGIAALLAAAGDGLVLHAILDPTLDVGSALEALQQVLRVGAR
jgi:DNA-binding transcriptional regulator YbjK